MIYNCKRFLYQKIYKFTRNFLSILTKAPGVPIAPGAPDLPPVRLSYSTTRNPPYTSSWYCPHAASSPVKWTLTLVRSLPGFFTYSAPFHSLSNPFITSVTVPRFPCTLTASPILTSSSLLPKNLLYILCSFSRAV